MTRCEYVFTYPDFLESMKAYHKISKRAAIGYWLYVWILPAVSLAVGLVCLIAYFRQDEALYGHLFWPACIGLAVAWALPMRYRIALRRGFKQRNALAKDRPMFCEFDESTVRFIVPDGTEVAYPWRSFTEYFENERVAVLFIQNAAFHTIPKRAMGEDGWVAFRQLVNQHVRKN
jgi:YcxB-like protein